MKLIKEIIKHIVLFVIGGFLYYWIEIMWRGYSHYSMALLGGICFILIGRLNEQTSVHLSILKQGVVGAVIITTLEFLFGCILNLWLQLDIWDYTDQPFNIFGQICIPFTALWVILSIIALLLDDLLRCILFGEDMPTYK